MMILDEEQVDKSEDDVEVAEQEPDVIEPEDESVQVPEVAQTSGQDDPYLTQLAVTLTQMTTELTAEATVLTRGNHIVAYSGEMPVEDIDDLGEIINNDWEATTDNARIRFVTLPSSGSDYMLYSKATVGNFTLSMIFAGTKQLRVIRRQGERLLGALEDVPDGNDVDEEVILIESEQVVDSPPVEDEQSSDDVVFEPESHVDEPDALDLEPVDVGPKQPYTFIWLVESFEVQLSEHVAQQLVFWLQVQLNNLHWTTYKLEVHQDFVYLHADVPGEFSPSVLIRSLMERSAKIAQSEDDNLPDALWADAYLVLTPGRDMTDREIQRFLNFARGEL